MTLIVARWPNMRLPILPPRVMLLIAAPSVNFKLNRNLWFSCSPIFSANAHRNSSTPSKETTAATTTAGRQTPVQALAARIARHADNLAAYHAGDDGSSPSNSLPYQKSLLPASAPVSIRAEQLLLRDAISELSIHAIDAADFVPHLQASNNTFWCIAWLVHFGIPELLPLETVVVNPDPDTTVAAVQSSDTTGSGPGRHRVPIPAFRGLDYMSISERANVPLGQLKSIARMAMLTGFLAERQQRWQDSREEDSSCLLLAHSPLSASMVSQPDLLEWMRFSLETRAAHMAPAMIEATELVRQSQCQSHHHQSDNAAAESPSSSRQQGMKEEEEYHPENNNKSSVPVTRTRNRSTTAYSIAYKTTLPIFAHLAANPELQKEYARYMRVMTTSNEGMVVRHLVEGWREGWQVLAESRRGVLVDVGGSDGHASRAVAAAFPGIRKVVVQDLAPRVVELSNNKNKNNNNLTVGKLMKQEGKVGGERDDEVEVIFREHDFFEAQPPLPLLLGEGERQHHDGDAVVVVYLLRQILHDWDDEKAVIILRNLADALEKSTAPPNGGSPGSRILLMDTVLPLPGEWGRDGGAGGDYSRTEEALLRVRDLTMAQAHDAHERTMPELEALVGRAHRGLRIRRVVRPFRSLMAIVEISMSQGEDKQV